MLGAHPTHIITDTQRENMSISLVHNERVCAIDTERVGINLLYQYQSIWQFFLVSP